MSHHLDSLVMSAKASHKPLAFVILDIDLFKTVNDTHGHDIGDEVLKEVVRRIVSSVRESDLACRYGGEEFVVVMPDTDTKGALTIAERLRRNIESKPIEVSREPGALKVTVSVGLTSLNGDDDKAKGLLHRADQALYRAKHSGRNRVIADAA
jgi:two-component system cell cycle response regulator